jgi:hypothetical protein
MWGMAPEAEIYSYRVCEPNRECWGAYVAAGIYAAIADSMNIINMSLDGPGHDEAIQAAIDSAIAHNILVVGAAGNSPPFSYIGWPASYAEVVSVGAIAENREPWTYSAPGFNDGDYVREPREIEFAAPGAAVLAALKSGCWVLGSGTSLASPMVAGLAAKLWTGDAVATRARLQRAARVHDLYVAGDDTLTGFGLPTTTPVFQITATTGTGGTVSPSGAVLVSAGSTSSFTIAPSGNCSQIQDVEVDGVSQGPISSYAFTNVTGDHTLHARFSPLGAFTITASAGSGGTISPGGASSVACGGSRTYTIAPSNGCQAIQDVKVDGVSRGPISSYTFTNVSSAHTIQASFRALGPFTITAIPVLFGLIDPPGVTTVACGASRSFAIIPEGCRQIVSVKVDGVPMGPISTYTFTNVRSNHTIQAAYSATNSFMITAIAGPGGSISPGGTSSLPCNGSRTYTIAPAYCHRIQDVKVDGVSQGPIPVYFMNGVTANHTIEATFSPSAVFTITATAETGGTISPNGASSVACGGSQSYTITPADCHAVERVLVDGVSKGAISSYRFTDLSIGHTIVAHFSELGPFSIDASAGPGGAINPSGVTRVACGGSQSYTIAAAEACSAIGDVQVDGVSIGSVAEYTFTGMRADRTISATAATTGLTLTGLHTDVGWTSDGSIDLTVTGGVPPYTYEWSHGAKSEDVAALAAGAYTVRVTDARGCEQSLSVTIANAGPAEPALGRPAPNPASGPVRMRYGIPASAAVRLTIVDLQGREVAVLAQGTQPAGWSWATWDGSTRNGPAPGGVYFIRLQVGGRHLVQRLALIR